MIIMANNIIFSELQELSDKSITHSGGRVVKIGKYVIGNMIGSGQFSSVRQCNVEGYGSEFAVKVISKNRIPR